MSEENVELIRSLQPPPEADLTALFRDDAAWVETVAPALAPLLDGEFEANSTAVAERDTIYRGLSGLRDLWLDWLKPWASYRTEIEEMRDLGDDVLVLTRDYGLRAGVDAEVALVAGAIWTVRDGKIVAVTFYANRGEALEAAGLSE